MSSVIEARKETVSSQVRRRLGRQPSVAMQAMVIESTVDIPLAGQHVKAGQRTRIVVQADEAAAILSMVEHDEAAVAKAKERCESDILKKLREETIELGTPAEKDRRDYYPDTWQAKFLKINDRPPGCLVFAETVGAPFAGHPDGLDKDDGMDAIRQSEMASVVASAVAAAIASPELRALIRGEAVAAIDSATAPREEPKPRK